MTAVQNSGHGTPSSTVFNESWHRVSGLVFRLRAHLGFHRHSYRGVLWFVLGDPSGDRYHRFTPRTHELIQRIDGTSTVEEIWTDACAALGDEAPTQAEMIGLLAQLHGADALVGETSPDVQEVFRRYATMKRRKLVGKLMSPLFMQFSILDPERFLVRTMRWVRWVFAWQGLLLWCSVVGMGAALLAMNFEELTEGFTDRVFATQNLVVLWFVYPVIKVLHEFGHAYTVKHYGGEVHDLGVLLMIFMPLPFVDASSASTFREKRQRVAVGAAGIVVELFLAGLAMLVWVTVEEGVVRAVAYNTVLIAGVSTLLFNGNPLLRYDGYYILSDLVEIPNLRQRSTSYLKWIGERYLFRHRSAPRPESTTGERRWFVGFGVASFIYRIFVLGGIILLIADRFFFLGAALAVWSVATWLGVPLVRAFAFLLVSPRLEAVRARAIATTVTVVGGLGLGLFAIPMPHNTTAEGVVWGPEGSMLRAEADGFVKEVLVEDGQLVEAGQALLICEDRELTSKLAGIEARLRELQARYNGARTGDRVAAAQLQDQIAEAEEEREHIRRQVQDLTIRAPVGGQVVLVLLERLPGLFIERGRALGRVIDFEQLEVRVVVPQDSASQVASGTQRISLRLVEAPESVVEAELLRQVPVGREELPSSALGSFGGGSIVVDPSEQDGNVALEPVFEFELAMIDPPVVTQIGGRVYARFEHEWSPYGPRVYRELRQLFLSKFDI